MSPKRFLLSIAFLLLAFGLLAGTAQAETFSLTGGGGQTHIGNGLMLPIQQAAGPATTGTNFPTLLVPVAPGTPTISGTVAKPLLTAGAKRGFQRRLTVPQGVLSKPAAQTTVGIKFSNPFLFAVGTNLKYTWPAAPAVFSTGAVGPVTVVGFGGTMTYSNSLGSRFGGPAQFALAPGAAAGLYPGSPITVYLKINGTTPPCTHPAFGGGDAACVAGMILAQATGVLGVGGATLTTVMTPGVVITGLNIAVVKMGLPPLGTITAAALAASTPLPTNMATSQPGPWTTGKIIISNPAAGGAGEKFTLSGKDSRTALGGGVIQMVSGALSARPTSGANANRGWVQLELAKLTSVPSMSPLGLAAMVGLLLLAFGYATRRRIFA